MRIKGKMLLAITLWLVLLLAGTNLAIAAEAPQLVDEQSIEAVIDVMTLEEKANLVVGAGWGADTEVEGVAGQSNPIPRLGIPEILLADGPAGLRISPTREGDDRTFYATAFPIATSLASTWDVELAEAVGKAQGNEVREYGVDILLAPAMNLHRNPLTGRNFEYYSEDPLVSGKIAAAFARGAQSNGIGVTLKHFAANNQETNRFEVDTIVSQRALRELYLRGFEIAVKEGKPWAVMSAYNVLNGTPASHNKDLLTGVLREDWGFEGMVMTDWGAGNDPVAQMKAQNDLLMPGRTRQSEAIVEAVRSGKLDEEILDRNVRNILRIILKSPSFRNYEYSNEPDLEAHAQLAREAATQGMVLLKNQDKTLPLAKGTRVAVFGNAQIETIKGGTGSGDVNAAYTVSIVEGLDQAGFNLYQPLLNRYRTFISTLRGLEEYQARSGWFFRGQPSIPEKPIMRDEIEAAVENTDVAIIAIGRNSGEGEDREKGKGDFLLTDQEQEAISDITEAYHEAGKKVVVVLNIGGPIEVVSWRDKVDAILLAWQPGQEAGHAIADVLCGTVNPSGKLATTFPVTYSDVPSAPNFPGTPPEDPERVFYEEDVYVGYRYYSTFGVEPAYEFGYGLSYTAFEYSDIQLTTSPLKEEMAVSVAVENTGDVPGKEVVQVYITAPDGKLEKPALQLVAFGKTRELKPGERQTLKLEFGPEEVASFDEDIDAWIVEAGTYKVHVAASSKDIRGTVRFSVDEDIVVERVNDALAPAITIDRYSKFDK